MKLSGNAKKFLGNSGWMIGQQLYYMMLQLVIGSLSARYLGPSNYGLLNYGASIISFFTIICKLGMDGVIINEMIKAPEKRGSYLGSALVLRLCASITSLFLIIGIIRILEPGHTVLYWITFLQSIAVVLQTYEIFNYWFQLNLKMKYVSLGTMLAQTIVGIWRIALLATKASVYFFALSSSIQFFVCAVVVIIFFRRERDKNLKLRFNKEDSLYLLRNSYHFIITGIAVTFYMQIDKIMIGKLMDSTAVGIYTAAVTIAALWEFIPNALVNSARPLIIELRGKNYQAYIKRFQELLLAVSLLSVCVSIGIMVLGRIVVRILYGVTYADAYWPLSILIWSTGFAMIGTTRNIWLVAEGYNKYSKYLVFVGAVVNFTLNMIAIRIWGIIGAAITTLVSQFVVAFISPLFFKEIRGFIKIYLEAFQYLGDLVNIAKRYLNRAK